MKYHPSYFKYVKDDYLWFLEQLQMDWATAEHPFDFIMIGCGCILAVAIPTILSPIFAFMLYKEWKRSRVPYEEIFIKEL